MDELAIEIGAMGLWASFADVAPVATQAAWDGLPDVKRDVFRKEMRRAVSALRQHGYQIEHASRRGA